MNFDISIVSCATKKCLTAERLDEQNIPYILKVNPEHPYPNTPFPYEKMVFNPIGAYRCFLGHQLAISNCQQDVSLILEDDVGFKLSTIDWIQVIEDNLDLTSQYDVVYLHLRSIPTKQYLKDNKYTVVTDVAMGQIMNGYTVKKGLGTLAYLMGPKGKEKLANDRWDGMPIDVKIPQFYKFAWLQNPDLFIHDDTLGSMTDGAV